MVTHCAAPRFTAEWTTGEADLTALEGLFWQEEGSDSGEDSLTLHSFQWQDKPPDQATFESLMKQATLAIDGCISSQF